MTALVARKILHHIFVKFLQLSSFFRQILLYISGASAKSVPVL